MNTHTDLNVADLECLTAVGLGIVRQADIIASTLCILDRSSEDTDLMHQPDSIAESCPCVEPI